MNRNINVQIKKLRKNALMPKHGSSMAAGYDVYAAIDQKITIAPHETVKVGTGLAMAVEEGYWIGVFARSGLATKEGLRPANCTGIIDSDYRGEVIVALHNDSDLPRQIFPQERIAQLVILPCYYWNMKESTYLNETVRGDGGFGSTGQ